MDRDGGGTSNGGGPALAHSYSGKLREFLKSRTGDAPPRIEAAPSEGKAARDRRKLQEQAALAGSAKGGNASQPPARYARTFARKHRENDQADGHAHAEAEAHAHDDEPDWGALAADGIVKRRTKQAGGRGRGGKVQELGREEGEDAEREAELIADLPALIGKARSRIVGEVREAAEGLRDLSKGSERAVQFLCDSGGIIALLQLLRLEVDEAATEHAVLTVLNLALHGKSIATRLLVSHALPALSGILCRSHNPSILSNSAAAITALVARGGTTQVPSLSKQGTVPALLALAENSRDGSDGRHDALRALARLAGSEVLRWEIVEEGGVELALRLALSGDGEVLDEVAALLALLGRTSTGMQRILLFQGRGKGAWARGEGEAGDGGAVAEGDGEGEWVGGVDVLVQLVVGQGSSLTHEMAAATLLRMAIKGDDECKAAVVAAESKLLPCLEHLASDDGDASGRKLKSRAKGLADALAQHS